MEGSIQSVSLEVYSDLVSSGEVIESHDMKSALVLKLRSLDGEYFYTISTPESSYAVLK
jgi:hypothetical protein